MSAFYVWSPSPSPSPSTGLEVLITRGDTDALANGTKEFARKILSAIGTSGDVTDWKVTPYRSKYFSEYIGEEDWRDNWQLVWRFQIALAKALASVPRLKQNGIGVDGSDDSWTPAKRIKDSGKIGSLVLADFKNVKARDAARDRVFKAFTPEIEKRYKVGLPKFHVATISPTREQLQIDLGTFPSFFYEQGAEYAETVMNICRKAKGSVHFQQEPK